VPAWIAATVLAASNLPSIFAAESGALGNLLPSSSEALVVEREALDAADPRAGQPLPPRRTG
jgi:hypothetical protein